MADPYAYIHPTHEYVAIHGAHDVWVVHNAETGEAVGAVARDEGRYTPSTRRGRTLSPMGTLAAGVSLLLDDLTLASH